MNKEIYTLLKILISLAETNHLKNIGIEIVDKKLLDTLLAFKWLREVHPNLYIASDNLITFVSMSNLEIAQLILIKNT